MATSGFWSKVGWLRECFYRRAHNWQTYLLNRKRSGYVDWQSWCSIRLFTFFDLMTLTVAFRQSAIYDQRKSALGLNLALFTYMHLVSIASLMPQILGWGNTMMNLNPHANGVSPIGVIQRHLLSAERRKANDKRLEDTISSFVSWNYGL